jgi:hypothetical protein
MQQYKSRADNAARDEKRRQRGPRYSDHDAGKIPNAAAINIGRRTPTRSIKRPTGTENVIGTSANSESNMPTVNGEASSFKANSDKVTRHPA